MKSDSLTAGKVVGHLEAGVAAEESQLAVARKSFLDVLDPLLALQALLGHLQLVFIHCTIPLSHGLTSLRVLCCIVAVKDF